MAEVGGMRKWLVVGKSIPLDRAAGMEANDRMNPFLPRPVVTILLTMLALSALPGCSNSGVAERQESISNTQDRILENRATRIQARDERMTRSREVWLQ